MPPKSRIDPELIVPLRHRESPRRHSHAIDTQHEDVSGTSHGFVVYRYANSILGEWAHGSQPSTTPDYTRLLDLALSSFARTLLGAGLEHRIESLETKLSSMQLRLEHLELVASRSHELDARFDAEISELSGETGSQAQEGEPEDFDFSGAFEDLG